MSLTPSKLFMNWTNVTVTPLGGSSILIAQVTQVHFSRASRLEAFYGDAYMFAKMLKAIERKRMVSIHTGNAAAYAMIPDDTPCTVAATLLDPRNGAAVGGGGITTTLLNCILEKSDADGHNNKFAQGTLNFQAYGGVDSGGFEFDPMSVTYL